MCKFKKRLMKLVEADSFSIEERDAFAEELTFIYYTTKVKRLIEKKDAPPELYHERKNMRESPLDFLERVWKDYKEHGALHQDQLERIDKGLYLALKGYMPKRNLYTRDFLPAKKERTKRANDLCHDLKAA